MDLTRSHDGVAQGSARAGRPGRVGRDGGALRGHRAQRRRLRIAMSRSGRRSHSRTLECVHHLTRLSVLRRCAHAPTLSEPCDRARCASWQSSSVVPPRRRPSRRNFPPRLKPLRALLQSRPCPPVNSVAAISTRARANTGIPTSPTTNRVSATSVPALRPRCARPAKCPRSRRLGSIRKHHLHKGAR